jgi:hypothetical protein
MKLHTGQQVTVEEDAMPACFSHPYLGQTATVVKYLGTFTIVEINGNQRAMITDQLQPKYIPPE